jgi:hypothetical protein
VSEWPLKYVNRLSDLFFVLSRWISKQSGDAEYLWQQKKNKTEIETETEKPGKETRDRKDRQR